MKNKTYRFSILILALAFIISIAAFFGVNTIKADAEGSVTVSGTNVFTAEGDASVRSDKQGDGEDEKYFTMFALFDNDDSVSYRRNLAYFWRYGVTEGEGDDKVTTPSNGKFNMEIGFKSTDFEKFVITFESQQYNKSKDSKSINYVMFFPAESGVKVLVTTDKDSTASDNNVSQDVFGKDRIKIEFGEKAANSEGKVNVKIISGDKVLDETFENVGGNYSKSSTSSTSPVYPLIFNAEFSEEENAAKKAEMVLYNLNGQSFQLKDKPTHNADEDYYNNGAVSDNQPPVLCLEEEVRYFTAGQKFDFDYRVIDVLRSSPSDTKYYYLLKWNDVDVKEGGEKKDFTDTEIFEEVKSDTQLETDVDVYLPYGDAINGTAFGDTENLKADMAVKVYLKITDTTSNGESANIFLDWYVDENYQITVDGAKFLAVAEDELGVTYKYEDKLNSSFADNGVVAEYQAKVDEAAENLSAGSSSYLYLPSPEALFEDNATAYTDMKFSIYFYHNSQQSNTSLSSNNLSINVTQQGAYTFTIFATDAAGNDMYYLEKTDKREEADKIIAGENGDEYYKYVKFASSDIWTMFGDHEENGDYYRLPWFHFNVGYTGVSFEETPGKQSTAYVGTSYSSASFKINGISGSYDTVYRLFLFDRAAYYRDEQTTLTYDRFIESMDELFEGSARKYFIEIPVASEVTEADENYEELKAYGWSNSSTTFTPQVGNAFYMVRAEVTDKQYNTDPVACNLAVAASVNAKSLKGEDDWLQKNVASVVLLCIAGVAFIGIVLLLVIKPKETADIDEQFENIKNKKAKKGKK